MFVAFPINDDCAPCASDLIPEIPSELIMTAAADPGGDSKTSGAAISEHWMRESKCFMVSVSPFRADLSADVIHVITGDKGMHLSLDVTRQHLAVIGVRWLRSENEGGQKAKEQKDGKQWIQTGWWTAS